MGDVRFPWYARKYCRPRRDLVDTSVWKKISTEDDEESIGRKKSYLKTTPKDNMGKTDTDICLTDRDG